MKIIVRRTRRTRDCRGVAVEQIRYGGAPFEAHLSRAAGTWLAPDVVPQGGGYRK